MMIYQLIVKPSSVDLFLRVAFVCDTVCALLSNPRTESLGMTSAAHTKQQAEKEQLLIPSKVWTHHA